jgi:hypothetical protein
MVSREQPHGVAIASMSTYVVEENERDINASGLTRSFVNATLKSKVSNGSWIVATPFSLVRTEQIMIPRTPLRRLHPAHPAIRGTAEAYESKLLNIFPELAEVESGELEKSLQRMRGKEVEL